MLCFQSEQDFQAQHPPPEILFYLHNGMSEMVEVNLGTQEMYTETYTLYSLY